MVNFKSKIKFTEKEVNKFLKWLEEWSSYRGGMLSRVDGIDIENALKGKLKYIKKLTTNRRTTK